MVMRDVHPSTVPFTFSRRKRRRQMPCSCFQEFDGPPMSIFDKVTLPAHEKRCPQHLWTSPIRTKVPLCVAHAPKTCFVFALFSRSHKKLRPLSKIFQRFSFYFGFSIQIEPEQLQPVQWFVLIKDGGKYFGANFTSSMSPKFGW